jgi:uncharacterized protein (DUF952 family)
MILHIVRRKEWDEAVGSYAPASLTFEGFIHCSTIDQVVETANRFYRGQNDLVLVCVDERRLTSPLRYEAPSMVAAEDDRAGRFPHLFGPLNLDAVIAVINFPCGTDGMFQVPEHLPYKM